MLNDTIKIEDLYKKRKELGLSRNDIAGELEITSNYLGLIETKKRTPSQVVLLAYYGVLYYFENGFIRKSIGDKVYKCRLHNIWDGMKSRCYNKRSYNYRFYGKCGIKMCREWIGVNGFNNFYEWAKNNGYKNNLTIDRVDVSGNYEPKNCRWVSMKEQENNRGDNVLFEKDGKIYNYDEIKDETSVCEGYFKQKMYKNLGYTKIKRKEIKKIKKSKKIC